jgi:ECF sigma factor
MTVSADTCSASAVSSTLSPWEPLGTCRPSRDRGTRSTRAATSFPSGRCCTSCVRANDRFPVSPSWRNFSGLSEKRGGGAEVVSLDEALVVSSEPRHELIALDDALNALAAIDLRKSQVVEMRFFASSRVRWRPMSERETAHASRLFAAVLRVSRPAVRRLCTSRHIGGCQVRQQAKPGSVCANGPQLPAAASCGHERQRAIVWLALVTTLVPGVLVILSGAPAMAKVEVLQISCKPPPPRTPARATLAQSDAYELVNDFSGGNLGTFAST